jgi:hypothetical protein
LATKRHYEIIADYRPVLSQDYSAKPGPATR